MARPKAKYKNEKFLFTLPPLMKARLDAQAEFESQQNDFEEISRATLLRAGLEMYLKKHPLPEGYLEDFIKRNYSEEEQKDLFELLKKQRERNDELYK